MLDSPSAASVQARRDQRPSQGGPSRRAWSLMILAAAFLVAAIIISTTARKAVDTPADANDADGWAGALLEPARERPDFTLTDTEGEPYDFADETEGKLTFLYFGYTNCPDICPVHLNTLTQALRAHPDLDATVVFVSTDPQRDSAEVIRTWLDDFSPAYVGLTGTPDEIDAAAVASSVVPAAAETPGEDGFYLVAHAAEIIAVTPDDRVHLLYPFGTVQSDWSGDLQRVLDDTAWMTPPAESGSPS